MSFEDRATITNSVGCNRYAEHGEFARPDDEVAMVRFFKTRFVIFIAVAATVAFNGNGNCYAQNQSPELQYKLAAGFYERGQWEEAKKAFGEFLTNNPQVAETPQANFFLAETMMQQQQFRAAYLRYQQFLKQYPGHTLAVRAMFRMGESAFRDNKKSIAVRMLEEFTRKHPQHELNQYALCYLGQLRLAKSEPQLAQLAFERSLQAYPSGPMAVESRLGAGNALMKQGYHDDARQLFEYCVENNENKPSIADEAKLQLGLLALYRNPAEHEEAQKWFAMVAENASDDTIRATAILSWARSIGESKPVEAYELLEPIIGWELPSGLKTDLLIEAAIAASKTDRSEIAIGWLKQVRFIKPYNQKTLDAVRFELRILESQDMAPEAIQLATEFNLEVEKRTLIARTQEAIGRQQYSDGDFGSSLETFGTLLKLKEANADQRMVWRYFQALNFIGLKKLERAEKSLEQISDDFSDENLKSLVQFCKASVKFRLEKYGAAIPYFLQYLNNDLDQNDRDNAKQELAICYAKTNRIHDADLQLDALLDGGGLSLGGIDDELESVVELVADSARQENKQIAEKWYSYLKQHSTDEQRRMRADRWLLVRSLETPIEKQTLSGFQKLFIKHPQDIRLVTTAIKNAKRIEAKNDIPTAIRWYELALANASTTNTKLVGGVRIKIAKLAYKQGSQSDLMLAKEHLEAWLANSTKDEALTPEVLFQLAWVYHDLSEPTKSIETFNALAQNFSSSKYWPDAAYRVAKHRVATKDYLGAKEMIDKILAKSDLPDAIKTRSYFLAGKIAFANQDWHAVETAMQSFVDQASSDDAKLTAKYFIAEALFQQQKNTQASKLFNQLHENSASLPSQYQPWVWLRTASLQLSADNAVGAAKLAAEAKDRFSAFQSGYEFDYLIARGLESEGLLNDARKQFEKVVASPTGGQTETAAHSQWRIGETFFHQEKYELAIAEYYKVDSLYAYPKWRAAALIQAGKCQEHLTNPKNAAKLYRQLLDRYPTSEFAAEAKGRMAKLNIADVKTEKKQTTELKTANQNEYPKY